MDVDALLEWYEEVRRPLPWRETRDPYALLVSEVMLQQTQALRVVPYYERWLDEFPDGAHARLGVRLRDVLALWSGLGYNRRALALQRAAAHVAEHGWPSDLTALPGVGKYTAAAVSSFAWDRDMAAVDTNVRRVITRREGDVDVDVRADELLPRGRAATFNQAMMELGATVCRPRNPGLCAVPGRARLPPPGRHAGSSRQAREIRGHRSMGTRARDRLAAPGEGDPVAGRAARTRPRRASNATA